MKAIAEPFVINGQLLPVAASIGVAVYPDDDADIETLIEKADLAMYAAKQRGKGASLRFQPSMQARAYSSLILETALRHAQAHNEFILTYQPKISVREQRITGARALLRWQHPELGVVMPLDFLPVLEQSSLILPVGAWVMATAAAQVAQWMEKGHLLTVAVHLSPRQFFHKEIAQVLADILEKAGVPGRCIELEITEAMLIDKAQNTEEILRQFKQLGVRLAISDFGTGYASLNYLRRFPLDVVKIDKSFVDDLSRGGAMVRAIIEMAHSLNMQVIAAGVETGEQLEQLAAMGCDEAFGFFLSAAVPPQEVEALLAGRRQRVVELTS
jgi:EAL domain-containing protein (putative c-di-GMP-specific phosphodiesterase class I)